MVNLSTPGGTGSHSGHLGCSLWTQDHTQMIKTSPYQAGYLSSHHSCPLNTLLKLKRHLRFIKCFVWPLSCLNCLCGVTGSGSVIVPRQNIDDTSQPIRGQCCHQLTNERPGSCHHKKSSTDSSLIPQSVSSPARQPRGPRLAWTVNGVRLVSSVSLYFPGLSLYSNMNGDLDDVCQ